MHSHKNQTLKSWQSDEILPIENKNKEFLKICLPAARNDPHKTQTAKDQIFLLLSATMPWTKDTDVVHRLCTSMLCASDIYIWDVWFSRDEEIEIPNVAN